MKEERGVGLNESSSVSARPLPTATEHTAVYYINMVTLRTRGVRWRL
jgi:hypothetical protein